jgi:hypothetical protein
MSAVQPIAFLDAVAGYTRGTTDSSADKPIRLAVIDPAYQAFGGFYPGSVNPAQVTFEGETTLSGKSYPVASGFMPQAGNRVYMVPIGNTYLITGNVTNAAAQGFYAKAGSIGVELGGGSYFDVDGGLSLDTDAYIGGDLVVDGIGARIFKWKAGATSRVNATVAADPDLTVPLSIGRWKVEFDLIIGGDTGDIQTTWTVGGTQSGTTLKTCWGPSQYTVDTATADETQGRDATPMRVGVHGYGTAVQYGMNSASFYTSAKEWAFINMTAPGSVTLNWAQETTAASNPTALQANSSVLAERIA